MVAEYSILTMVMQRRFVKRLQNAHKVYSNLAVLLEEYAKQS